MKSVLLILVMLTISVFAFGSTADNTQEDNRLCKVFSNKVQMYKKNMRKDEYAKTTLQSYEKRAQLYCSK